MTDKLKTVESGPFFIQKDNETKICTIHYHCRDCIKHDAFEINDKDIKILRDLLNEVC